MCSATAGNLYNSDAWRMGVSGAMFQMIAHGISSAGMFFLVGVVYDRVHHRDLDRFGGLFQHMPTYAGISMVIFFAALGLPGLCGFIGEVLVVLSVWNFSIVLAVISAAVVILTAGYILWTIQRVYLGPEYKGPHAEALRPMSLREIAIAAPLVVMAVVLGVFPKTLLNYTDATIDGLVDQLNPARQSAHPFYAAGVSRNAAAANYAKPQARCQPIVPGGVGFARRRSASLSRKTASLRHDSPLPRRRRELARTDPICFAGPRPVAPCGVAGIVALRRDRAVAAGPHDLPRAEGIRSALLHHARRRLRPRCGSCASTCSPGRNSVRGNISSPRPLRNRSSPACWCWTASASSCAAC